MVIEDFFYRDNKAFMVLFFRKFDLDIDENSAKELAL